MQSKATRARHIAQLITADPGLPSSNPTTAYWQRDPHPLASSRSQVLRERVDIAIIGSGITGAGLSKALLERDSKLGVTVFEARTLCSGATGRNGGQLATSAGGDYASLARQFGPETAGKIVRFTLDTITRMREIAKEYAPDTADCRDTTKVRVYLDQASFKAAKESIAQLELDHPDLKGEFQIIEAERLKDYGVSKGVGGFCHSAGTMWPYRLITAIFSALLRKYAPRFAIEMHTPVTNITYDGSRPYPYQLQTPRGLVQCTHVIHCTNGHAGHLLPGLRGRVFPVCGSMTVQDLQSLAPNLGSKYSWGFHYTPRLDLKTERIQDGLFYLIQNAKSNLFFFGGDNGTWEDTLHGNDGKRCASSENTLQSMLPRLLSGKEASPLNQKGQLVASWSGVMGFSSDGLPLVGRLPEPVTSREGFGEWCAVAFNGYGMANCWLAAEALATMIIDGNTPDWLPGPYVITAKRWETCLSVTQSVQGLQELENQHIEAKL